MSSRSVRAVQAGAGLVVVCFVGRYLIRNWDEVRRTPLAWEIHPGWIALSLALVLVTYAVLIESWRRMLAGWGPRLAWRDAARIWIISSMGKYLPGKVWAIAGMAWLSQRLGVPAWAATASAILLQVVSLATGALIAALAGIAPLEARHPGAGMALVVLVAASVAGLAVVVTPGLAGRVLRRFGIGGSRPVAPAPAAVAFGIAANALAWSLYGVALWLLARGVLPSAGLALPEAIGGFAASYIAGYLFLLAPGGLGVRESVFVVMLEPGVGLGNALALAAVSRFGMTLADVLASLPFLRFFRETVRHAA